jgi:hypothetical protein
MMGAMTHAATLRLGELLISAGLIDRRTLDEALGRQGTSHARLGEVLVEMGLVERGELPVMLALQAGLRGGDADWKMGERLRIGRLLLEAGEIDEATLERALERSRRSGRRLGETLVEAGAISGGVLQRFLQRQRRLAAVALAGLALVAALPAPAIAADQAQVSVVATVLARAFVERQQLPQSVVVSEQDVARGYVDLEQPVEIGIRTNHTAGVHVDLSLNSRELQSVDVREAQGGEVRTAGVFVPQADRGLRPHTVLLKLRLNLSPHAVPGTIAYPFTVSLSPA